MNIEEDVVKPIVDLIELAIPVLAGIVLLLFLVTVVRYIAKAGDAHGKGEERKAMGWGLLALFILFSIWGIISIFKGLLPDYSDGGEDFRPGYPEQIEV